MNTNQEARTLRILARALVDVADMLDGSTTLGAPPPAGASDPWAALPKTVRPRARYLQAFIDNGGQLTMAQVYAAAKAAEYGNPGSATTHGYVKQVGADYYGPREITAKGRAWLSEQTGKTV